MTITRADVLANRMKWVAFLKEPERKKATGALDAGNGCRCCLGHGCYVLDIERTALGGRVYYGARNARGYAPAELIDMIGLHTEEGRLIAPITIDGKAYKSLARMNDDSDMTPQQIGAWLEERLDGTAPDSPWKPLSDYPEVA